MKKKIAVTGKTSRVAKTLKKYFFGQNITYLDKKEFNILNFTKINSYIKKNKIKVLIHLAALSRPMKIHEKDINKSIELNMGACSGADEETTTKTTIRTTKPANQIGANQRKATELVFDVEVDTADLSSSMDEFEAHFEQNKHLLAPRP